MTSWKPPFFCPGFMGWFVGIRDHSLVTAELCWCPPRRRWKPPREPRVWTSHRRSRARRSPGFWSSPGRVTIVVVVVVVAVVFKRRDRMIHGNVELLVVAKHLDETVVFADNCCSEMTRYWRILYRYRCTDSMKSWLFIPHACRPSPVLVYPMSMGIPQGRRIIFDRPPSWALVNDS